MTNPSLSTNTSKEVRRTVNSKLLEKRSKLFSAKIREMVAAERGDGVTVDHMSVLESILEYGGLGDAFRRGFAGST